MEWQNHTCPLHVHFSFPRTFNVFLDRRSAPAGRHGGGCSAAPCRSSRSTSRSRCANAASASLPAHLARVRSSHGGRARKLLTSCAQADVRRNFLLRLRWGCRTRTHRVLVRRHGFCEQVRCVFRQSATRARAGRGCSCPSYVTDARCCLAAQDCSLVRSWARARLPATGAYRREALDDVLSMDRMCAGTLVALRARSFRCVRDTRASPCGKSGLFAGAVCGSASGLWRIRGAFWYV